MENLATLFEIQHNMPPDFHIPIVMLFDPSEVPLIYRCVLQGHLLVNDKTLKKYSLYTTLC